MALMKLKNTAVQTWIWLVFMVMIIAGVGLLSFFTVTDKGAPTWDYRTVKSLPGSSPYAEYQKLPFPQHVTGKGGK